HIGDRVCVNDIFSPLESPLQYTQATIVLSGVSLVRVTMISFAVDTLRVIDEMTKLAGHRTEITDLPEQPFEAFLAASRRCRHEPTSLFREMDQDWSR